MVLATAVAEAGLQRVTGAAHPGAVAPAAPAAVLTPVPCNGSLVVLTPPTPASNFPLAGENLTRGSFVTALKDFQVCAMGAKLELGGPRTLNVYIYAADHVTRGALLASGSVSASGAGPQVHYVPVNYTLKACQDYELVFDLTPTDRWELWDTHVVPIPFDCGGVVRVRYPTCSCPLTFGVPHIELIGVEPAPPAHISDFSIPNGTNFANDGFAERGIYVNMRETSRLSSFGFEADLAAGQVLTATVYNATGTTRGAAVGSGTYLVPASGMQWHDVPVNALLAEGKHYDIAIQFGTANAWYWWSETSITEPFTRDVYDVLDAEAGGDASNFALPHFRAKWAERAGGIAFDLAKPNDPLTQTNQVFGAYGLFVTTLVRERIYAVGWFGDIAPGQTLTASVYFATGNTRNSLLASGSIVSGVAGMRWHDIPLSAELQAGVDYDINLTFTGATTWRYWSDLSGVPYTNYGVIQVRNGEYNGDASNAAIIQMRLNACNATLTPVDDAPLRVPMFLAAPSPNPAGDLMRVDFQLEENAPVSLHIYDVQGRLVSTVLEGGRPRGWSNAEIDSKHLASGVYFLKLQTPQASVTRKFVVVH
jgi:hypothetical protein